LGGFIEGSDKKGLKSEILFNSGLNVTTMLLRMATELSGLDLVNLRAIKSAKPQRNNYGVVVLSPNETTMAWWCAASLPQRNNYGVVVLSPNETTMAWWCAASLPQRNNYGVVCRRAQPQRNNYAVMCQFAIIMQWIVVLFILFSMIVIVGRINNAIIEITPVST
jgi:hypothetical protein